MKKVIKGLRKIYQENDKKTIFIYVLLRTLIIICMVRELINGDYVNAMFCILSLILFLLPSIIEKKFKIDFPSILESIIYIFIFAAEILGEINNFYGNVPYWDIALHTTSGFLLGSIGFSLIYLLNEKTTSIKLSPIFVALVSFCFSMTVGIVWEMFEYGMDVVFKTDMQKDEYVEVIRTVDLDPEFDNNVVTVDGIEYTIAYDKKGNELVKFDGYLDIGLHDTMLDLIVNFIGALIFSIFGYLYATNEEKYKLAGNFMTKRKEIVD